MSPELKKTFWNALADSPFVMIGLSSSSQHHEPMTVQLDKDADHAVWFFTGRGNRIASGGPAMLQFASKDHEVFACLKGTLTEETDTSILDKHWSKMVSAWYEGGKSDPNLLFLRFDIGNAEIWTADMGLKSLVKAVLGRPIDPADVGKHEVGLV